MAVETETELAMLVLGLGVGVVALRRASALRQVPRWPLLAAAYAFLLLGWSATCLEGHFAAEFFNLLEHASGAASGLLVATWSLVGVSSFRQEASRP